MGSYYSTEAEHPWDRYPAHAVFRHKSNNKWFAVIMDLPKRVLGLSGEERISVVNFKCDYLLIRSLLGQKGFFPGYHMNKSNWITVALDGSVEESMLRWLLGISYDLTDKPSGTKLKHQ